MASPTTQKFKGDALELKFEAAGKPTIDTIDLQKETFFDEAYDCAVLGDMIHDNDLSPLINAIKKEIFRDTFQALFESFRSAGTFESYISVFKKIFGDSVTITFTIPAAGKLTIAIIAEGIEESPFVAQEIVDNTYEFNNVVDDEDDNIVFQTIKGFQTEYELRQMLFEMVPDGIWTTITLTLS